MKNALRVLLFMLLVNPLVSSAQKKFNVVFIGLDDLSIAFDAYGNPQVPLPNFARLMQHGTMFKTAYCQYPLCSPSRTSIFSGKVPDSTGIYENGTPIRTTLGADYKFLPEYFHMYGYQTERYSKFTCTHEAEIAWDYISPSKHSGNAEGLQQTPLWWIDTLPKTFIETPSAVYTNFMVDRMKAPVGQPYFYSLGLTTHNPFTPILDSWNKLGDSNAQELLNVDIKGTKTNVMGNGSGSILLPATPANDVDDIPAIALKTPKFILMMNGNESCIHITEK